MKKLFFLLLLLLAANHKPSYAQNECLHIQYILPTEYENTHPLVQAQKKLIGPWLASTLDRNHFNRMALSLITNKLSPYDLHSLAWQREFIKGLTELSTTYNSVKFKNKTTVKFADFLAIRRTEFYLDTSDYRYSLKKSGRVISLKITLQEDNNLERRPSSA